MLRIVEEHGTNNLVTLRLDGRLVSQWVGLLRRSCEQSFDNDGRLIIDLTGVSFADREGVQLLHQLEQQHVKIINCSPFLQEQLRQTSNGLPSSGPASD